MSSDLYLLSLIPFILYGLQQMKKVILPKDAGFKGIAGTLPRTKRAKRKADSNDLKVPEKELQKFAESLCEKLGIQYIRIPDGVYRLIFANPRVSLQDKKHIKDHIAGVPDLTLLKRSKRGNYNIAHCLELKTKDSRSKLRQGQKAFLYNLNHAVPRTKEEIEKEILDFYNE